MSRVVAAIAVLGLVFAAPAAAEPGGAQAPQYYFGQWDVSQLWNDGARGQGVTIAEIDTGVDVDNGVFGGRVVSGVDFGRLGGTGRVDRDVDDYGHGTSMASIMVGKPGPFGIEGLAPAARVLPVAIPLIGTTEAAPNDHLPQAIRWAADHGARIISMSLGGVRRRAQYQTACPDDEQQAIFYAMRKGALLFAASGNRGSKDNAVEEPSVCLGVISVGAVDRDGQVASFSSRHRYLTMSAPGVNIPSVGPGGAPFAGDGTSQATAIASAATALVWSKYPKLTASQLLARMLATLDHRSRTRNPAYGYGIINPLRAITARVPTDAPDPVYALAAPFLQASSTQVPKLAPRAPIARAPNPPGTFAVGSAPPQLAPQVVVGIGVAAAGIVLLVGLGLGARRARKRRAAAQASLYPMLPPAPPPFG